MDIKESKKIINKKLNEKYVDIIMSVLDNEKMFITFAALISFTNNHKSIYSYLADFGSLVMFYLMLGTLSYMIENKKEITEIAFYRQLKIDLKNNINLFKNINEKELDDEIKRLMNIYNVRF